MNKMEAMDKAETSSGQPGAPKDLGHDLWKKIEAGDYSEALSEIKAERHHNYLVNNSLDLVPVVAKLLAENLDADGENCVQDILVHIASVANPKEAVLVFLEELEMHRTSLYFRILLHPIHTTLMRQVSQSSRGVTFSWIFNTLYSCLAAMKIPTGIHLEGKERILLDIDPDIVEVSKSFGLLVDFYQGFYFKVLSGELVWSNQASSRDYLAMFLLQLYHKPLAYLDVYCASGEVENSLYRTCGRLTTMVCDLVSNPIKLFSHISWDHSQKVLASEGNNEDNKKETIKDEEEIESEEKDKDISGSSEISQLSLSCFYYCILSQRMAIDYIPQVYSNHYVYINCVPLIVNLLKEKENIPIHKGLMLTKCLLDKIEVKSLPGDCLEAKGHSSLPQLLVKIMIYCDVKELRTLALDIFKLLFSKFDSTGRRKLINALLLTLKHAGALGLVIHELKENIAQSLKQKPIDPNFSGKHLIKLIKLSCSLPDAEKTDMLEWSDCIIATLNLLIFIFLCDRDNLTGIREIKSHLEENYLELIQKGLELSRCHYELKLKNVDLPGDDMDVNVLVGNDMLPKMHKEQERGMLKTALCSLDMMQCVLSRAKEAVEKAS